MNELQEAIDDYLIELAGVKRASDKTVISYRIDLHQFNSIITSFNIETLGRISEKQLKRYLFKLNESGLSKQSVSRKLSSVRGFFNYLIRNELIENNPAINIKNPRTEKRLPQTINLDSFSKIIKLIEEEKKGEEALLYKIFFEVLYGGSLRVSELCALDKNDFNPATNTIKVFGKGAKERIIPIGKSLTDLIKKYLSIRNDKSNLALFTTLKGRRLYPRLIHRVVSTYISKVSDISKKSPHVLRHSSATHMLDNGADLMAVKEILGHENLSTTQIYTHVSVERLKKTFKNAHPKS
ncbi:MAG: tyrosine recombinase XerC [Melioribacteraceae bacterium]|nr:MAG: tyrosine recombinase XerC [Melioribacteraceae bacterium]